MSSFKLEPPKPGLKPEEYRKYVKDTILAEIARLGEENVLEHKDFVILFSGPSRTVRFAVGDDPESNNKKSLKMAIELNASRINDTQAAISLDGHTLGDYFRSSLKPFYSTGVALEKAVDAAYAEVWGGISELFAELDFKTAATAVCGAGQDRVFVKDELPVLVKNPHLKTINKIDMRAVRAMYKFVSPDEAFRLVCLSEMKMTLKKARATGVPPTEGWKDFFERQFFYSVERADTETGLAPLTDKQKARKERIIKAAGLQNLFAEPPVDWAKPHRPPAELTYTPPKTGAKPHP